MKTWAQQYKETEVNEARQKVEQRLQACGWERDRWGHYQKTMTHPDGKTKRYRYEMGDWGLRQELRVDTMWMGITKRLKYRDVVKMMGK